MEKVQSSEASNFNQSIDLISAKDAITAERMKANEKLLLKLGQTKDYQVTPYIEIYEKELAHLYSHIDSTTSTPDISAQRKAAGVVKSTSSDIVTDEGWTPEKIMNLSPKEWKLKQEEITKYLTNKRKGR
jgi:hypothetical protein